MLPITATQTPAVTVPNDTGLGGDVVFTRSHYFQVREIELFASRKSWLFLDPLEAI
jgi:hypothetical protein